MNVKIYQIDYQKDNLQCYCRNLKYALDRGGVNPFIYDLIYECERPDNCELEDLFDEFNIRLPDDFDGNYMSTSDIILLNNNKLYYCDSIGWKELCVADLKNVGLCFKEIIKQTNNNGEIVIEDVIKPLDGQQIVWYEDSNNMWQLAIPEQNNWLIRDARPHTLYKVKYITVADNVLPSEIWLDTKKYSCMFGIGG